MRSKFLSVLGAVALIASMFATPTVAAYPTPDENMPPTESVFSSAQPRVQYRMPSHDKIEWRLQEAGRISAESDEQEIQQAVDEWMFKFAKVSPSWVHPKDKEAVLENERTLLQGGPQIRSATAMSITASVLAIPVEFSATETLTFLRPNSTYTACTPVTETFTGPMHGNIPYPGGNVTDTIDNNTAYYPSTEVEDYEKLIFGTTGITEPLREGDPNVNEGDGVDISGLTVQTYYDAQSDNSVTVAGEISPWVPVTHTEAYYGIDLCVPGYEPPATADGQLGRPADLVVEAAESLKAQGGDYATYDFWKRFDNDDDGVIDTLWIIHAGRGQEAGGGAEGEASIWSHSTDLRYYIQGGYTIHDNGTVTTTDDLVIGPFTFQPEDGDLGVFTEEFGHNFFHFPDLYTTDTPNSVGWWSHMSAGSWGGELGGTRPVNMPLWFRMTANCSGDRDNPAPCGWADPIEVLSYTTGMTDVVIGQAGEPAGDVTTEGDTIYEGVRIDLPDQEEEVLNNAGEGKGAYSTSGDEMDNTLDYALDLSSASAPITLTVDAYWDIEENWDYGYVMINGDFLDDLDGVLRETNPNGNNLGHGLTGAGAGALRFDLSAYAGQSVTLRFRYRTDVAVSNPGWWIDNVAVSGGILSENFEGGLGDWTNDGWQEVPYIETYEHYYLVEWRNDNGFDKSLLYPYNTNYSDQDEWRVDRVPANVPAAVVMYRNTKYDFSYSLLPQTWDPPSVGSKYGLLVVDTNFWPVEPMTATFSGRLQSLDAPLALQDQPDFTLHTYSNPTKTVESTEAIKGAQGVSAFHDALGYYPGFFFGAPCSAGLVCYWDQDASAVVPSKEGKTYSTRITDYGKNPLTGLYGATVGGFPLGSGDPRDDNAQFGVHIEVVEAADDGSWGKIQVWNSALEREVIAPPATITEPGAHTLVYGVRVRGTGDAQNNSTITVTVPSEVMVVDASPSASATQGQSFVWENPTLSSDTWETFIVTTTYTAEVGDEPMTLDGSAVVDDGSTPTPTQDDVTTVVSLYDVDATVIGEAFKTGAPGETVTYTVRITNTGHNLDTFDVSAAVDIVSWSAVVTGTEGTFTMHLGDVRVEVPAGEARDVEVSVVIHPTANGEIGETIVTATSVGDDSKSAEAMLETGAYGINFVSPTDGQEFTAEEGMSVTIPITVATPNFSISEGQWRLSVDDGTTVVTDTFMAEATSITRPQGTYTLTAELMGEVQLLGPSDEVVVSVVEPTENMIYLPLVTKNFGD